MSIFVNPFPFYLTMKASNPAPLKRQRTADSSSLPLDEDGPFAELVQSLQKKKLICPAILTMIIRFGALEENSIPIPPHRATMPLTQITALQRISLPNSKLVCRHAEIKLEYDGGSQMSAFIAPKTSSQYAEKAHKKIVALLGKPITLTSQCVQLFSCLVRCLTTVVCPAVTNTINWKLMELYVASLEVMLHLTTKFPEIECKCCMLGEILVIYFKLPEFTTGKKAILELAPHGNSIVLLRVSGSTMSTVFQYSRETDLAHFIIKIVEDFLIDILHIRDWLALYVAAKPRKPTPKRPDMPGYKLQRIGPEDSASIVCGGPLSDSINKKTVQALSVIERHIPCTTKRKKSYSLFFLKNGVEQALVINGHVTGRRYGPYPKDYIEMIDNTATTRTRNTVETIKAVFGSLL